MQQKNMMEQVGQQVEIYQQQDTIFQQVVVYKQQD
jgi:hypothetical protein